MAEKWTVVQHSGYGYAGKPGFKQGLEPRSIDRKSTEAKIVQAGGLVFDDYLSADTYCMDEMYWDSAGVYPHARGGFAKLEVDGLKVFVPSEAAREREESR